MVNTVYVYIYVYPLGLKVQYRVNIQYMNTVYSSGRVHDQMCGSNPKFRGPTTQHQLLDNGSGGQAGKVGSFLKTVAQRATP